MNPLPRPQLQIAVDCTSLKEALALADCIYPHYDILEIGTPLLLEEGLGALEAIKERYPDRLYLADVKIMDAGRLEADSAFRRGADIVTALALADDRTIAGALEAADRWGGRVMIDAINCPDPVARAVALEGLGVSICCFHTAHDTLGSGGDPLGCLEEARRRLTGAVAVAGGLDLAGATAAVARGANIVIVGSAVAQAQDPGAMARSIRESIREVQP